MRISIGKSRKDTHWKPVDVSSEDLCEKLSKTFVSSETMAEYKAMTKEQKAEKKDIGGFVGGVVEGGRRNKASVKTRSLITLDADYADKAFADNATALFDYAMCIYSTHSSTPKAPRLRVLLPLNREVRADEYEPIARSIAKDLGIEQFDVTTYETNRLMYWPSTPKDGEYIFRVNDGEPVDADAILSRYRDWKDVRDWPTSSTEGAVRDKRLKAQGDPTSKPGLVGLFCRTYDVPSAIDVFLSDVYEKCEAEDRYTFLGGSSTAGVVIYQDGQFAYSHHATDPANGMLCNAFDLVRVHKFGDLDYEVDRETPVNKLPSYQKMCELVQEDDACKRTKIAEDIAEASEAFKDAPVELDWTSQLHLSKSGAVEQTVENLRLILEHDPNLSGKFAMNQFTERIVLIGNAPWRNCDDKRNGSAWNDADDAALRCYIEETYGIYNKAKVDDALMVTVQANGFHPIRNYLEALKWDGTKRAEALFVDNLGAEDSLYTREVTRKWLLAAVTRVYRPGCKFDNMVVLVGDQGIGKSYLGGLLGRGWFSDTFGTVTGKEAYEQLKGAWIIEMGELSALKKAEVESVKLFISKQEDNYRAAYGHHTKVNKRQCVFYGTTNDDTFLRDRTGNRRFWPIQCGVNKKSMYVFDLLAEDIDQIWAEAVTWFKAGEGLFLSRNANKAAAEVQDRYMAADPRVGVIEQFLEKKIPANWKNLTTTERRNFIQGFFKSDEVLVPREEISVIELAYELYGKTELQPWEAKEFHNLLKSVEGWKYTGARRNTPYGRQRVYERIDEDEIDSRDSDG